MAVSKAIGKPVKLIWTREEEMRHGRYRTQAAIRFRAGFAADGTPLAFDCRTAAGSANPAAVKDGLDLQTVQGLSTTPYRFPNLRVETVLTNTHVPLGPWRAPGHSQNAYFMESFIDELAYATGRTPTGSAARSWRTGPTACTSSIRSRRRATGASRWSPAAAAAWRSTKAMTRSSAWWRR